VIKIIDACKPVRRHRIKASDLGCAIGRGLLAGICGTAAMTISSTIEMKLRGRPPSTAPADAALKLLRLKLEDEQAKAAFANIVHWGYGTGWGVARGLLDFAGCSRTCALPAHFAAVWGAALVTLPALKVAPPATEWSAEEVAIDALHHLVYAAAVDFAYTVSAGFEKQRE